MKFQATVDCLDVKTITSKVLLTKFLDLKCCGPRFKMAAILTEFRRPEGRTEPHACIEIERRATFFFIFITASGMNRGRVRPTTTTTSYNMAVILQLILSLGLQRTSLIFDINVMAS